MQFIALLRVCFQCVQSVNAAVQPPRRPLGSETPQQLCSAGSARFHQNSIRSDANLKNLAPKHGCSSEEPAVPPGFVCSAAALRCSQTEAEKVSGAGGWCAGCCRTQRGRKRRLDLRLVRKPASPLRAAGGQGSCVGLSLILRRGRTTVAPRIVPEPLQQRTDSQLLFSLMGFFKPRSHLNN